MPVNQVSEQVSRRFQADILRRIRMRLDRIDAAVVLMREIAGAPSHHPKALKGLRAGQHSIWINDQWRICFIWSSDGAAEVELVDYHY